MKKLTALGIVVFLALFSFAACGKKAGAWPAAGAEDMLNLLPKDAQGVVVVDVHRAITTAVRRQGDQRGQELSEIPGLHQGDGHRPAEGHLFPGDRPGRTDRRHRSRMPRPSSA